MMRKLLSAITSMVVLTGTTVLPASSLGDETELILDRMSYAQRADFETIVTYLGYASAEAFISETLAMRSSQGSCGRV